MVVSRGLMISTTCPPAGLLAHQDGAPGRTPNGVTGDGAAENRLDAAVGEPDALDSGKAGVVDLVADDEVGGWESFGQSAIMSMLVPAFEALVTTRTRRPLATVASEVGSASAVA